MTDTSQDRVVPGTVDRVLMKVDLSAPYTSKDSTKVASVDTANVVTSLGVSDPLLSDEDVHYPVLDLDVPCTLVPSSTPGNFHLYIDKAVTHKAYMSLLWALASAGLIEEGYASASTQRGFTAVRVPWVKKDK